ALRIQSKPLSTKFGGIRDIDASASIRLLDIREVDKPDGDRFKNMAAAERHLMDAHRWKHLARWHGDGYYSLQTEDTRDVPVRLFLTRSLLDSAEDILYRQIVNATRFTGARMVVITPDVHYGYGVPVGCVLITDYESGAIAMGPVGYDIGCGMMSAK